MTEPDLHDDAKSNRSSRGVWSALSWPNRITILRLVLVAPFVVALLHLRQYEPAARYVALGIFVVMAASDFVDGILARRLNQRTRLGAILDPLADKVMIACATVLLALPGSSVTGAMLPKWLVVAVIAKDLWATIGFIVVFLVTDRICDRPTRTGKASTIVQLTMVTVVLLSPELNRLTQHVQVAGHEIGWWAMMASGVAVAALCTLSVMSYTRLGLRFMSLEAKPLEDDQGDGC